MIVRILTEGQFRLPSAYLDDLNDLDNRIVEAVAHEDRGAFGRLLPQMLGLVREHGSPLPAEELTESDIILPASDSSMEEVAHLFAGEGIIGD
ncbi:MAG: hypothetical protein GEU73_06935 [Chloroflexi bacterium]|nr:hypothetical protein [Chloroflexota bacterium]